MGTGSRPDLRVVAGRFAPERAPAPHPGSVAILQSREDFQRVFLPHLDAAYNLARWLLKSDADAQDVVQEAYLRALRFFRNFRGGDARAWLLTIVRNTAYSWMSRNRPGEPHAEFDEEMQPSPALPVDIELIKKADSAALRAAMEDLPSEFREVVVLRDLEGMSYKEIAEIADVPIGTVMSRLARARSRLRAALTKLAHSGGGP